MWSFLSCCINFNYISMKVAIIGTVGVPANYGGFETLVEQLIEYNHSEDLQYAVYCSRKSYTDERWVYMALR